MSAMRGPKLLPLKSPNVPHVKVLMSAVVRYQHKYYIQIALFSGLILPWMVARWGWNEGVGGLVWGGVVARIITWSVVDERSYTSSVFANNGVI